MQQRLRDIPICPEATRGVCSPEIKSSGFRSGKYRGSHGWRLSRKKQDNLINIHSYLEK